MTTFNMEEAFQIVPPEFEPVSSASDLSHLPLAPSSQQVSPHINVVAPSRHYTLSHSMNNLIIPVWPILHMCQSKNVEQLVSSPDVVDSTTTLAYWTKHQHVGPRTLQVS